MGGGQRRNRVFSSGNNVDWGGGGSGEGMVGGEEWG